MSSAKNRVTKRKNHKYLWWLLIVLALGAILVTLELEGVAHFFNKTKDTPAQVPTVGGGSTNEQKGEPHTDSSANQNSSTNTGQPGDDKNSTSGSAAMLTTPTGDFVSNHHPNLGGSPAPNTLASVCSTTPGATCQIFFTKDGVTKSLPVQTTDRGGATYWSNWSLQSIGLTTGSWQVKAIATLSGQTKSAEDAQPLVVSE